MAVPENGPTRADPAPGAQSGPACGVKRTSFCCSHHSGPNGSRASHVERRRGWPKGCKLFDVEPTGHCPDRRQSVTLRQALAPQGSRAPRYSALAWIRGRQRWQRLPLDLQGAWPACSSRLDERLSSLIQRAGRSRITSPKSTVQEPSGKASWSSNMLDLAGVDLNRQSIPAETVQTHAVEMVQVAMWRVPVRALTKEADRIIEA